MTHLKGGLTEMPDYVMEERTLLARNMGAEIIQFEPYVYFFDNFGEPKEVMLTMWSVV